MRRRTVIAAGIAVAAAARGWPTTSLATPADATPGGALRWSPPRQADPVTVATGADFFGSPVFAPDQDVIVELPATIRRANADIEIRGGRHVRIVGGHAQGRLMWRGGAGSLFVEGLLLDLTRAPNKDAIVVMAEEGRAPDVYLQNVLVRGVQGTKAGLHADVFQPYGPIGHLRVHGFTADSNYQGFFIRPENAVGSATFSRVNMRFNALGTPEGNTYLFWCRNFPGQAAKGDPLFPVEYGRDVYAEASARAPGLAAAFPPPHHRLIGRGGTEFAGIAAPDGSIRWPEASGISGQVKLGAPPGGDFVRADAVGLAYRSPGYAG